MHDTFHPNRNLSEMMKMFSAKHKHTVLASILLFLVWLPSSSALGGLEDRLQPLIDAHKGEVCVMVKHLSSGEVFAYREDEPMPTASLIKFPLMIAAYQAVDEGAISLDDKLVLREEDKVPGSGILTPHFSIGTQISLNDAIHLMMVYSDNTATNLVIDHVGIEATGQLMKQLDCPNTMLHSKVYRRNTSIDLERSRRFGLGSTTASEMIDLLERLQDHALVSKDASEQMADHMLSVEKRTKFRRLLPAKIPVLQKGGSVSAARTAAGIIRSPNGPIALCVLTDKNEDTRWSDDNAADLLCSHIAKETYDYFNDKEASGKEVPGENQHTQILRLGADGPLVEDLQRTLNAKLNPSPGLSVDGDFGPLTEQAVIDFQKSANLPPDGEVGSATWTALGPLQESSDIPAPEIINAEVIEKQPADTLSGPPFVTCKAWAIGDGATGQLLWGAREHEPLDMASTTKIMTAYLVTSLAQTNPEVLEETVVFSSRADETIGSSSRIRQGEQIPVEELLYGLLLPSGNDASVALAEHFGDRLHQAEEDKSSAYERFVAAMNSKASELGMANTHFTNTHGLTEEGHHTSSADLLKLAYHAMRQPLFRKVVGTVQHGCTVTGPEGYKRNLLWRNTNRLLRIEGFGGVKTGTTTAAGSCLVSQATRNDRSLIVVVLGSSSTDARYADTKNLYRWAWCELGLGNHPSKP